MKSIKTSRIKLAVIPTVPVQNNKETCLPHFDSHYYTSLLLIRLTIVMPFVAIESHLILPRHV
ncbi:hypothetical protein [Liquorilactobacillus satsumensis]|uniref:Uncharacterized protein n=1 Tax=Liquorilactobacillus satsumensis DSM 16230 = JCM 12392 TaxID=1423801 RepID=A0A0R1UX55_9LACO|nr:hypothetical protein [Liquorilactobacillus satsumensis]KRL97718.1 hypothetical protein FD50_GL001284 [Liquorilactobacillus satsumensis DSM 16230 = JCM 12392]